jgi:SsrA-binding protein
MERKVIATNRKAFHDYHISDRIEAGLVLTGTEIKSIRNGRVDLRESFAKPQDGELWLYNCVIPPYEQGNIYNQPPTRPRKLLLHKEQIRELIAMTSQKGYTLVPLQLYIKNHVAKVELGIARGKRKWEKRQAIIEREKDREAREALKHGRR